MALRRAAYAPPVLDIAVLGPVEVRRDGQLVRVPSGRTTEVLVRLAVEPGVPVAADRLIEDLWEDGSLDTARNTLQSKVSQLRRALGADLVVGGTSGYLLDVEADTVDLCRVNDLAATVAACQRAGDVEGELAGATNGLA